MPVQLQPQNVKLQGLRASVIRMLHQDHFEKIYKHPFHTTYFSCNNSRTLLKRKCEAVWHKVSSQITPIYV